MASAVAQNSSAHSITFYFLVLAGKDSPPDVNFEHFISHLATHEIVRQHAPGLRQHAPQLAVQCTRDVNPAPQIICATSAPHYIMGIDY